MQSFERDLQVMHINLGIEYDLKARGTTRKPSLYEERVGVTADACNEGASHFFWVSSI